MDEKPEDYSGETDVKKSALLRWFFLFAGTLSLVLGIAGIFLPLLPTTPFLLLSAACYARGSARFYNWLLNNRWFGEYIHTWRREGKIARRHKKRALALILITSGISAVVLPVMAAKIFVVTVCVIVSLIIWRLPESDH